MRLRPIQRLALATLLLAAMPARAAALSFATPPSLPALPTITLSGAAQTDTATMNSFAVSLGLTDLSGFNITVAGNAATGDSPVFEVYCPLSGGCGTDPLGYVAGGARLPAGSLTLNTTGAGWTESGSLGGVPPVFSCTTGCPIDVATPVKIASEVAPGVGLNTTWTATGFGPSSLSLAIPTTLLVPKQAGEVYRVDLLWSLNSGP